jgi:hypothetical protein
VARYNERFDKEVSEPSLRRRWRRLKTRDIGNPQSLLNRSADTDTSRKGDIAAETEKGINTVAGYIHKGLEERGNEKSKAINLSRLLEDKPREATELEGLLLAEATSIEKTAQEEAWFCRFLASCASLVCTYTNDVSFTILDCILLYR